MTNLTNLLTNFVNSNTSSTLGSGSLPSNIIANPKGDIKAITTRSGVSYNGTQVPPPPSSLPKVVERETEVTKDTVPPTNNGSTEDVQPLVVHVETNVPISEPDDPTSPEVDHSYYDSKGDILLLEAFLNDDPSLPPPTQGMYLPQIRKELKICEAKKDKSSIDEPPEVELKDLPPHLEYAFLEGDDKLPIIIAKYLSVEEKPLS
ncbi:hypothetical protein Tco_1092335 [Tanacetum coccineum]|uniref:Reverse transcriptase domain-containing protein n=1 Tax=Tanacetum coccineum TaxID=301880 RepID=A0ABQ5IBZ6_9ASTR